MSDPSWAPQNQPQSALGVTATNVGRDQNTYNTYTSLSDSGMTLSYKAFKHAIDTEVEKVTDEAERQLYEVDQHYRSLLARALADFKAASAERDRAMQQARQARRIGRLGDGVTWGRLGVTALLVLLLGSIIGYTLRGTTASASSQPSNSDGQRPASQAATVTVAARPTPLVTVSNEPLLCDGEHYIVRLEAVPPGPLRDVTLVTLAGEYEDRIHNGDINASIHKTTAEGSCTASDAERLADYGFIWSGPFDERSAAEALCAKFRESGVSEDCYVTNG